jgi:glycosyltransferase involved in cell wall biosynthesis
MVIRRFDYERKYAVDIAVRTVLELSSRPVFSELEFGFYGDGDYFDELTAPLKNFKNVRLFRGFLDHAAVSRIHGEYGVALLPTRLDSQCVSVLEAAASGLVVVSSDTSAVPEFIPRELGTLAATENPAEYAGIIERLQADPGLFKSLGRRFAEAAEERCSFGKTVEREMELIAREERYRKRSRPDYGKTPEKVLTVVVPVYNMEDRLERCARSMLDGNDCRSLDMLIIDDGSTDGSAAVADGLAERHPGVVRVVRKENGGHGSVINRGLAEALGRYFRVVDSDDWVDSRNFGLFLSRLEGEDADAVITDFSEDWDGNPLLKPSEIYSNLEPFQAYSFNTLAEGKYGFEHWGPVLPSSTFRTGSLRKAALHLDEGIAYVDMEYAALSLACVESLRYYDLDVYRYSLGREGQTVSRVSYERKFKDHERVIVRIAEHLAGGGLAEGKRKYVLNNILLPLVNGHFLILTEYLGDEGEMEKFIGTIGRYPFLRDPAERQRRLMESRRTETARPAAAEKEGILSALGSMTLSALPFVFVSSMSPEVRKSGLRMIKHAVNYFVPYGVVTRYSMLKSALKGGRKPGAPNR